MNFQVIHLINHLNLILPPYHLPVEQGKIQTQASIHHPTMLIEKRQTHTLIHRTCPPSITFSYSLQPWLNWFPSSLTIPFNNRSYSGIFAGIRNLIASPAASTSSITTSLTPLEDCRLNSPKNIFIR